MVTEALAESAVVQVDLRRAILQTVAYADLFQYPLTATEIYRYLIGVSASPSEVSDALQELLAAGLLAKKEAYYTLPDREFVVEVRKERKAVAADLWPRAIRYGTRIAVLPFVRMVTVTGALAVDNVDPGADIDYLVVTEVGRLWFCRLLVISLVRLAARRGDIVCPNYLLTERALSLAERNLFAAHELSQMVPIAGLTIYSEMRRVNAWTSRYLPNAGGPPRQVTQGVSRLQYFRPIAEAALRTKPGDWLERWEMDRKIRKFSTQKNGHVEANFSPDWCKGHFDGHGQRILNKYKERLECLELTP